MPRRRHARLKVGDRIGDRTVVALLNPDSTSNERVLVRCSQGHEEKAYAFNLRKEPACRRCKRKPWRYCPQCPHCNPPEPRGRAA